MWFFSPVILQVRVISSCFTCVRHLLLFYRLPKYQPCCLVSKKKKKKKGNWIHAARHCQKNVKEWDSKIWNEKGSLTSATIEVNFDSLKLTRLLSCGVQSILSFQHHFHCIVGKTRDFPKPSLKINPSK